MASFADGEIVWSWRPEVWRHVGDNAQRIAPTTVANGVVFSGLLGINMILGLNAYDERSGVLLKTFAMPGSVNSGATPVGKMLFVGSGTTPDGSGSGVHAFTLP